MAAKVIVWGNQKGGPGKTTGCLNVAAALALRNNKVFVADGDPQSSLVEIVALATPDCPFPARVAGLYKAGLKIHQELLKYIDDYDFILVDCPPAADSPLVKSALMVADLAIVPFVPSAIDSMASTMIRDTIESVQITNPELKAYILLNRVEENWKVTDKVLEIMQAYNMPVLENYLTYRAPYVESPFIGNSVHALKDRKDKIEPAIREVEKLTDEILSILSIDYL
jgi:chromosome partitioning protein